MARTIAQIQASIVAAKNADPVIGTGGTNPLSSSSAVAIWLLWTWVIATCWWAEECLYDTFTNDVNTTIANTLPHTLQWYGTLAKAFQFGNSLPAGSDTYNPVVPVDPSVLIISSAVAVEVLPFLRIKVATGVVGALAPLSTPQLTAFKDYMNTIKDAGVPLQCTSGVADTFQPTMVIYYDPQVMGADGSLLATPGSTPVLDAVNTFLDTLPFNGVFVLNAFVATMQAVAGIIIADVTAVQAFYGVTPPVVINEALPQQYIPDAGYMALDTVWFAANVSYVAYAV
jgi:hypothetical protein